MSTYCPSSMNKRKDYHKQYYLENKEKYRSRMKQYYLNNKEKLDNNIKEYHDDNKIKVREYHKQYYIDNNDKMRNNALLLKFNITLEEYDVMFENQKGCCKICDIHQDKLKIRLSVDHCHVTNKVRGLLCSNCNKGIGLLGDNVINLRKAIEYLNQNNN